MTYQQARDRVLMLLNQYSVAGGLVAESYNNQQDYLLRIPGLLNDAMTEIAATTRKIPAVAEFTVEDGEAVGSNTVRLALPADFYQYQTGGSFLREGSTETAEDGLSYREGQTRAEHTMFLTGGSGSGGNVIKTNEYMLQGRKYLLVPREAMERGRVYFLTYYRYPTRLPDNPADDAELDNVPETHDAACFYAAAFLVVHDDPFLFASFYNKYEDKLAKMGPGLAAEVSGAGCGCGGGYDYGVYEV